AVALVERAGIAVGRAPRAARNLRVRGTAGARPGAAFGDVAFAGRGATHGRARQQTVGRTGRAHAAAGLGDVAYAGGRATGAARRTEAARRRTARGRLAVGAAQIAGLARSDERVTADVDLRDRPAFTAHAVVVEHLAVAGDRAD